MPLEASRNAPPSKGHHVPWVDMLHVSPPSVERYRSLRTMPAALARIVVGDATTGFSSATLGTSIVVQVWPASVERRKSPGPNCHGSETSTVLASRNRIVSGSALETCV